MMLIFTCGNFSLVVDTTLTVTCTGVRCVWPAGTSAMGISVSHYDPLKLLRKLPSKWEISNYRVTRWQQKQWYMYIYWAKWSFVFSLWDLYRIYLPNLPSIFTLIFIKKNFKWVRTLHVCTNVKFIFFYLIVNCNILHCVFSHTLYIS